jgi:hypothetical protein
VKQVSLAQAVRPAPLAFAAFLVHAAYKVLLVPLALQDPKVQ